MLRDLGAVFAGMFVGGIVNMGIILISWAIWPMPEGLDMSDQAGMRAYIATLPTAAMLLVVVAHLAQASVGGWIAARLSGNRPMVLAMIVGVLSMLGGVMNMVNLAAPSWMWIEMPLYLACAWAAGTAEVRRRGA